jgi:hypothetical protein
LTIGSFAAAGYLTLVRSLSPPPSASIVLVVTCLAIAFGALLPSLADFRFGRALAVETKVVDALRGAFLEMVTAYKVPPGELRLHFFRVQWVLLWSFMPIQKALVRKGHFALKVAAPLAEIRFTKGKGFIGEVWANRTISGVAEDLRVSPEVNSKAQWKQLTEAQRRKMSWKEYQGARHIEVVFAQAILADEFSGDVVAVISADTGAAQLAILNSPRLKAFLDQTAKLAWAVVNKGK